MTKKTKPAIEIKMATIMAVSVILHSPDSSSIEKTLRAITGNKDDYFDGEFAVIDVGMLEHGASEVDWPTLIQLFRKYSLNPVAVRNAPAELGAIISSLGLSIDAMATQPKPSYQESTQVDVSSSTSPIGSESPSGYAPRTMIIDQPVRGGQRVYARDCDVIVTAVVNSGAEIIADGSIFIYAPLRGRALAGAKGDSSARIFTTSMEAELISVAGIYRTFDDGMPKEFKGKAMRVSLEDEILSILPIDATSRR